MTTRKAIPISSDIENLDWFAAYKAKTKSVLWSHSGRGSTQPPSRPTRPWVDTLLRWLISVFFILMLLFYWKRGAFETISTSKALLFFIIAINLPVFGYLYLRFIKSRLKNLTDRFVFTDGFITDEGVFLGGNGHQPIDLKFSDIRSAENDYEQGAKALKIRLHNGKAEYVLFGHAKFHNAVKLINERLA